MIVHRAAAVRGEHRRGHDRHVDPVGRVLRAEGELRDDARARVDDAGEQGAQLGRRARVVEGPCRRRRILVGAAAHVALGQRQHGVQARLQGDQVLDEDPPRHRGRLRARQQIHGGERERVPQGAGHRAEVGARAARRARGEERGVHGLRLASLLARGEAADAGAVPARRAPGEHRGAQDRLQPFEVGRERRQPRRVREAGHRPEDEEIVAGDAGEHQIPTGCPPAPAARPPARPARRR